jgi:hypothetical protein
MRETNALLGKLVNLMENQDPVMANVRLRGRDLELQLERIQGSKYSS